MTERKCLVPQAVVSFDWGLDQELVAAGRFLLNLFGDSKRFMPLLLWVCKEGVKGKLCLLTFLQAQTAYPLSPVTYLGAPEAVSPVLVDILPSWSITIVSPVSK